MITHDTDRQTNRHTQPAVYRVSQNKIPQHENHDIAQCKKIFALNSPRLCSTQNFISLFNLAAFKTIKLGYIIVRSKA